MALLTPEKTLERISVCKRRTKSLRDRWESDWGLTLNEEFQMSKEQREWSNATANLAVSLYDYYVNSLAYGTLLFSIPITAEKKKQREKLAIAERFAYGCMNIADERLSNAGQPTVLEQLAALAPVRGWTAGRAYMYQPKGSDINLQIDIWDVFNTYWLSGANGLLWIAYRNYMSPEAVRDAYGDNVQFEEDSEGRVETWDVIDKEEEGVLIQDKWVVKPEKHGLDHVPCFVFPGGSVPLIQSEKYNDTIKYQGQSIYYKNVLIYPIINKLLTYFMTTSEQSAKPPMLNIYDSSKNGEPLNLQGDPRGRGAIIDVDAGQGQGLAPMFTETMSGQTEMLLNFFRGLESLGGVAPIARGEINQAMPAALGSLLTSSANKGMRSPQNLIEKSITWLVNELMTQYRNGHFGELKIKGKDKSSHYFDVDVTPSEIEADWYLEARLKPDTLLDSNLNAGIATTLTTQGLISKRRARDKYLNIEDPDGEQEIIDYESISENEDIALRNMVAAAAHEGDKEATMILLDILEERKAARNRKENPKQAAIPEGVSVPVPPQATASALRRPLSTARTG